MGPGHHELNLPDTAAGMGTIWMAVLHRYSRDGNVNADEVADDIVSQTLHGLAQR
jgi:hypothetical protein